MRTRPYRLAVVVFDEMDLLDVAGPLEVFSTAGRKWNWRAVKAELVATKPGPTLTRAQLQIGPTSVPPLAEPPELVLIPGGYGARRALEDVATTLSLATELTELDPSIRPDTQSRTRASERSITAAQNGCAIELGLEGVARLLGKSQASGTARELGYAWGTDTISVELLP
jgi:transcriptional regulator GlxA family with amidase domain